MGARGGSGVSDVDEDAVPLVVVLAVAVLLSQQGLCVADQTFDPTARHRLEVCARPQRLCAQLLPTHRNTKHIQQRYMGHTEDMAHTLNLLLIISSMNLSDYFSLKYIIL